MLTQHVLATFLSSTWSVEFVIELVIGNYHPLYISFITKHSFVWSEIAINYKLLCLKTVINTLVITLQCCLLLLSPLVWRSVTATQERGMNSPHYPPLSILLMPTSLQIPWTIRNTIELVLSVSYWVNDCGVSFPNQHGNEATGSY